MHSVQCARHGAPRTASDHQEPEEARPPFPGADRGAGPGYTFILASEVQNCEGIHFCCFKSPSLWQFISQPQEINSLVGEKTKKQKNPVKCFLKRKEGKLASKKSPILIFILQLSLFLKKKKTSETVTTVQLFPSSFVGLDFQFGPSNYYFQSIRNGLF